MDKCSSDAEFDSYWENEAKNKSRNRIRVGRQYQATIPPLLKPGDKDGRRFEDLETLKWKPDQLSDSDLERYLSMARSITSFSRAIRRCRDPEQTDESSFQAAIKGLTDFVTSHHPCHHDAGCKVPVSISSVSHGECLSSPSSSSSGNPLNCSNSPGPNEWSPSEAHLFSQAVEACGKNFCTIKKEYLPWKPVRSLIEYYYNYGKLEKQESPPPPPSPSQPLKVPSPCSLKSEKDEPVASCSHQPEEPIKAEYPETKEESEMLEEEHVKEEARDEDVSDPDVPTPVTSTTTTATTASGAGDEVIPIALEIPKDELEEGGGDDAKPVLPDEQVDSAGPSQATVGSLKFFLGGRLVLKLNAQQGSISGTRCQWVQSHDTPKHPYQARKLKHKKKAVPDSNQPIAAVESPTHKKRADDDSNATSEDGSPAAKKAKTHPFNPELEFPPLCSASWTPPVADGQESVELDDASSKTSEGCVSPVVFGPRGPKSEVRTETPVDHRPPKAVEHVDVQDGRNVVWMKATEPLPANSHSDGSCSEQYMVQNSGFLCESMSPRSLPEDSTCSHEVLNHKSALPHSKSATFYTRASRSGSPSAKLFNKRPSPCDLSEKVRPSSGFQSPVMMMPGNMSSETCARETVLDLSSHPDQCRSREANSSYPTYTHISPTRGIENCSSSEGSPHTPSSTDNASSACCKSSSCKSSNCISCRKTRPPPPPQQQQVPIVESKDSKTKTCRKKLNVCQLTDANGAATYPDKCCSGQEVVKENCDRCACCFDQSSSCTSPKCSKAYLSQDQTCNKEGQASRSPNQNALCVTAANEEPCPQKLIPWYGSPASSLFQFYPHTYPYYIAYGVNPATVADSSAEAPLDLSSGGNSKREKTTHGNVPDVQGDVPKTAGDAVDRGMLYQLLKNKVTK